MSNKYKIIEYKDRLKSINYPYTVASAIILNDGSSLAERIDELFKMINLIYYSRGEGDRVSSGFPDNEGYLINIPENSTVDIVDEDGNVIETRYIITTKDHSGTINFPRTLADAIIMPDDSSLQDKIDELTNEIIKMDELVNPLTIKSFTVNNTTNLNLEIGSSINTLNFNWFYNKNIASQRLYSEPLNINVSINPESFKYNSSDADLAEELRTKYYSYTANNLNIKSMSQATFSIKLSAVSLHGGTTEKSVNINFYNYIYYGAHISASAGLEIVPLISKKLAANKFTQITADGGTDKYIYILIPVRFGSIGFKDPITGFFGGFMFLQKINITNSSGYTEEYNVYRSDNPGLGKTTVEITNPS